jgi:hypothetical protein
MSFFTLSNALCKLIQRKFFLSAIGLLFFFNSIFASVKIWKGSANDGKWSNPLNWNGNTIPSANDDVILDNSFVSGNYTVTLPASLVTLKTVTISPAAGNSIQLTLPSTNTLIPGFVINGPGYGLVINNGGIFKDSSGAASMAPVSISDSIKINNGGRFVHSTPRSHAENVSVLSKAPGTEKGIFEFDVPGTQGYTISISNRTYGTLIFSANAAHANKTYTGTGSNPLTVNGDLQVNDGVNFKADLATANGNIIVGGDYIQNGGIFNLASGPDNSILKIKGNLTQSAGGEITESNTGLPAIELNGSSMQNISLQGTIANNITFRMNNPAGATLLAPLSLPYNLSLVKGNITTSSNNLLTLQTGAMVSVDSTIANKSFINGPLRKEGLSAASYFLFPVGKGSQMRWVELKKVTGNFTIEFIKSDPRAISNNYDNGIDHISANDYWTIDADASPAASANTELSFAGASTSGVTDMSALRVAQLLAGTWANRRNTATTGTAGAAGSVVSEAINIFGPAGRQFALASNTATQNPLPLKLISFSAALINNNVLLNWKIDSQDKVAYFIIMSSSDNQNFNSVGNVNAVDLETAYHFTDKPAYKGINYYRLQVVEKDGNSYYSNIVAVNNNDIIAGIHFTSYSLVTNNIGINITSPVNNKFQLLIINAEGKIMKNVNAIVQRGDNMITLDLSGLRGGVYYLIGENQYEKTNVLRFIKQ